MKFVEIRREIAASRAEIHDLEQRDAIGSF